MSDRQWERPVPRVGDTSSASERAGDVFGWRSSDTDRAALYALIASRRDVRRFRPDPVADELLEKILVAAHAAPSVGHSQPWRFIIVRDEALRDEAALIASRERLRQAEQLEEVSGMQMRDLKVEGLREAPVGIVVCCDRRAVPAGVLGRATFIDADLWSCACAIENLWLAARSEGLGVGWVTLFPPDDLARLVGLPEGVETLGWLCLGWPDERPPEPSLERAGWSVRLSLDDVVMHERWASQTAPPVSRLASPHPAKVVGARDRSDELLGAPGSLGVLEAYAEKLEALSIGAGFSSSLVLVGTDHPVVKHDVSTYDASVTREVLEAAVLGEALGTAAAAAGGMGVVVVDAGVNGAPVLGARLARPKGPRGDLLVRDALEYSDVEALIDIGRGIGADPPLGQVLCIGEVGIGNTTVGACLAAALLDLAVEEAVGLGATGDARTLANKRRVVTGALARVALTNSLQTPQAILAALGGPELAVLSGVVLGAASVARAIVLDGFVTSLSALVAVRLEPAVAAHLVAGQQSRERAHRLVLGELGLEPLLDLRLRSGEGVGAVLATGLLAQVLEMRARTGRVDR